MKKPSLLFVSARLPFPCVEGHQLRSFGVLAQLAQHYEVHLLSILRPGEQIDRSNTLGKMCASITGVAISTSLSGSASAALRGIVQGLPLVVAKYVTPDLVHAFKTLCDESKPAIVHFDLLPLAQLSTYLGSGTPWVVNEHNVESDLIEQKLSTLNTFAQKLLYQRELHYLRSFEENIVQRANLVLACSDDDRDKLQQWGAKNVHTIPNGVDAQKLQPNNSAIDNHRLVFLGGMNWYPNRLGVEWFIQDVMPLIVADAPSVQLDLIGNPNPLVDIPNNLEKNINRLGFVPDFVPYVQTAAVMIVPLHVGSGTRLKVVEGLALGKCMISTRKGAEGVGLTNERNILFADSAREFADAVLRVMSTPELRQQIEREARVCADEVYDWQIIGQHLRRYYSPLIGNQ